MLPDLSKLGMPPQSHARSPTLNAPTPGKSVAQVFAELRSIRRRRIIRSYIIIIVK
jgi:hypothetical protein